MVEDFVTQLTNQGLLLTLIVSGPPVLCSTFVGLLVALFQAVTQIQEQSLTFVPKIIVIFAILMVLGPMFGAAITQFARFCFDGFALVVGR